MNKLYLIPVILLLYINGHPEAMFAGNIVTVNPKSEVNALRNPAMMDRQKEENFSVIYNYSQLINSDVDTDVSNLGIDIDSRYNYKESYNGAVIFSGIWVSGRNACGLGISKTGDGQVKHSSSDFSIDTDKISEDKKFTGSSFLLSYSYRINSKQSIGLQAETVISNENTEKNMMLANQELESSVMKISSGVTIGYYIHENKFSFGAMVKPGMFGTEKSRYDLTDKTLMTEDHKKIASHYVHNEGAGILTGFSIRLSNKLLAAFEGGGMLPFTKKEKTCSDSLAEQTQENDLSYAIITRAGIDYSFNRFLCIDFGGGYTRYSADFSTTDNTKKGSFSFSIYQLTSGIDIKPSEDIHLLFGFSYNRLIQNMDMNESVLNIEMDIIQDSFNYTAGISYYY